MTSAPASRPTRSVGRGNAAQRPEVELQPRVVLEGEPGHEHDDFEHHQLALVVGRRPPVAHATNDPVGEGGVTAVGEACQTVVRPRDRAGRTGRARS